MCTWKWQKGEGRCWDEGILVWMCLELLRHDRGSAKCDPWCRYGLWAVTRLWPRWLEGKNNFPPCNTNSSTNWPDSISIKPPVVQQQPEISSLFQSEIRLFQLNSSSSPVSHTNKSTVNYTAQCQGGSCYVNSFRPPTAQPCSITGIWFKPVVRVL